MSKLDNKRILSKIDELNKYLSELEEIIPENLEIYKNSIKDKRACERLLQISIETIIDILNIITSGLKLGLPSGEEDLIEKTYKKGVISKELKEILMGMKGFRNILVHKYGETDNEIIYEILSEKLQDFEKFKEEIIKFINNN
ncbi:DUF86 domain-containing protein [Candidatus Pacearchaeota archaeon]|nr:DUF86 domain-containing protein [Candidatus Pacearchaeota archaeon]